MAIKWACLRGDDAALDTEFTICSNDNTSPTAPKPNQPGGILIMAETRVDDLIYQIAVECGGAVGILDAVFGFLKRRTDFFVFAQEGDRVGFPPGRWEQLMFQAYNKYREMYNSENPSNVPQDWPIKAPAENAPEEVKYKQTAKEEAEPKKAAQIEAEDHTAIETGPSFDATPAEVPIESLMINPSEAPSQPGNSQGKNNDSSENELSAAKKVVTETSSETLQVGASIFVNFIQTPIIDNYQLLEKLGEGAYGIVKKAKHRATEEVRACKKFSKQHMNNASTALSEMSLELELLKSVNHPNVIKTYEFYEWPRFFYVISELCQGGELFDYIVASGTIQESISANIMSQLFTAVSYMHNAGIIHRDLKPENLLLEEASLKKGRFKLKVADFGSAAFCHSSETLTELQWTPWYTAPEVINRKYDQRCDIWSAGVIMYILLAGTPPFYHQGSDSKVFQQILTMPVLFPERDWKNISTEARDLVEKLLEKDPNRRISLVDALNHEWIRRYNTNELKINEANTNALNRLRDFNARNKLQQAVASLITAQMISVEDTKELRETFLGMDVNKDGKLSVEEVQNGYGKVFGQTLSEDEVATIFGKVDSDNSGFIDYDEFLTATMNKERLFSVENLHEAFRRFDIDGSGTITAEEIKGVIGASVQDHIWVDLLSQADTDGNGEIDIEEFINLMKDV